MSVTWLVKLTYSVNSKKCCNAFQALNAALIRGRCLFESWTRYYYFPFSQNQRLNAELIGVNMATSKTLLEAMSVAYIMCFFCSTEI